MTYTFAAAVVPPRCFRCGNPTNTLDKLLKAYMAGNVKFRKGFALCAKCFDTVKAEINRRAIA